MPLRRGKAVGYDADLMAFKFTMRNGQQIVQCQVSIAALSDLADRRRGSAGDLRAEFKANRKLIEAIASVLFDQTSDEETRVVSIFSKHIPSSRYGARHSYRRDEFAGPTDGLAIFAAEWRSFQKGKQIINLGDRYLEPGCCTSDTRPREELRVCGPWKFDGRSCQKGSLQRSA